jgi:hypothetical protein
MKDKEQIKALKVAFFDYRIRLNNSEAKFWPIYNTFDDKQFDISIKNESF